MQLQLQPALHVPWRRCDRCQNAVMAPKALESSQSHAGILVFFFFFFGGWESYSLHIKGHATKETTSVKRKAIHSLQATLTTWLEADTKVCKEAICRAKQAAHKAVVHQPTAKPVHFQQTKHHLCLNQPNIAVKITTSRAYDVHCKPKGSSSHHNLKQWMKHTREGTAHIRACHRACQKNSWRTIKACHLAQGKS